MYGSILKITRRLFLIDQKAVDDAIRPSLELNVAKNLKTFGGGQIQEETWWNSNLRLRPQTSSQNKCPDFDSKIPTCCSKADRGT